MPSLSDADRQALLGPVRACPACRVTRVRHYCRSCDEFYVVCGCSDSGGHDNHRIYLWTRAGVIAIPDFDTNCTWPVCYRHGPMATPVALYRQMRTSELQELRVALLLDRGDIGDTDFCDRRVAAIDAVLFGRKTDAVEFLRRALDGDGRDAAARRGTRTPMTRTYWMSFSSNQKFLGVCVVDVDEAEAEAMLPNLVINYPKAREGAEWLSAATRKAWLEGCNPGGQIMFSQLTPEVLAASPHPIPRNRLMQQDELLALGLVEAEEDDADAVDPERHEGP